MGDKTSHCCCGCFGKTIDFSVDYLELIETKCFIHDWTTTTNSYTEQVVTQTFSGGVFQSQTVQNFPRVTETPLQTESESVTSDTLAGQFEWNRTENSAPVVTIDEVGDVPIDFVRTKTTRFPQRQIKLIRQARLALTFNASDMPWFGETFRGIPVVQYAAVRLGGSTASLAGYTAAHTFRVDMRGVLADTEITSESEFDASYSAALFVHQINSSSIVNSANFKSLLPSSSVSTLTLLVYSTAVKQALRVSLFKFGIADQVSTLRSSDWKEHFEYDDEFNYLSKFTMRKQPFEIEATTLVQDSVGFSSRFFFDDPDQQFKIEFIDSMDLDAVVGGVRYYTEPFGDGWNLFGQVTYEDDDITVEHTFLVASTTTTLAPLIWNGFHHRHREYLWEASAGIAYQTESDDVSLYDMFPVVFDNDVKETRIKITIVGEHRRLGSMTIRQIQNPADNVNMKCDHRATFLHSPLYHHQRFRLKDYSGSFSYAGPTGVLEYIDGSFNEVPGEPVTDDLVYTSLDRYEHKERSQLGPSYKNQYDVLMNEKAFYDGNSAILSINPDVDPNKVVVTLVLTTGVDSTRSLFYPEWVPPGAIPGVIYFLAINYIEVSKLVDKWTTEFPPTITFDENDMITLFVTWRPSSDRDGDGVITSKDAYLFQPSAITAKTLRIEIGPPD